MTLTNFQIRGTVFKSSAKFPYLEGYSHHLLVSSPVWVLKKKNDPISLIFFLDPPWVPIFFPADLNGLGVQDSNPCALLKKTSLLYLEGTCDMIPGKLPPQIDVLRPT